MKLLSYFFLIYLLSFTVGFTQPVTLQKTFGGTASDGFNNIQLTADSGYIMIGWTHSFSTINEGAVNGGVFLVKTDKNGETLWTKTLGTKYHEIGNFVQQTNEGGYILVGSVLPDTNAIPPYDGASNQIYLVKTNSEGDTLWTKKLGWGCGSFGGACVRETPDSGFFILAGKAGAFSCPLPRSVFLIRTNSFGDTLWTKTLPSPDFGDWGGVYFAETKDSNYIITGSGNPASTVDTKIYLLKIDRYGNILWVKNYSAKGSNRNNATCVQQTSDNGYIIGGYHNTRPNGASNIYLVKTDKYGDTLWTKSYWDYDTTEVAYFVREVKDKEYIITGSGERSMFTKGGLLLFKTDSIGSLLWRKTYRGIDGGGTGISIITTPDLRYVIAGSFYWYSTSSSDGYLLITDSLGNTSPLITKIENNLVNHFIQIYPNPNQGNFLLKMKVNKKEDLTINIFNVLGQVLENHTYANKSGAFTKEFNIQHLSAGVYFIAIKVQANMYHIKLIKN